MHSPEQGTVLLDIARQAIGEALGQGVKLPQPAAAWLQAPGATFVTLMRDGTLRGCIGRLEAQRPLHVDVAANAVAAALQDPRFAPLSAPELAHTAIEVSLLSEREPLACDSEAELLTQLRPGIDGLVFSYRVWRGTFLPQVWEQLPEPRDFLAQLRLKAGLSADFWAPGVKLERYTVTKWREETR